VVKKAFPFCEIGLPLRGNDMGWFCALGLPLSCFRLPVRSTQTGAFRVFRG